MQFGGAGVYLGGAVCQLGGTGLKYRQAADQVFAALCQLFCAYIQADGGGGQLLGAVFTEPAPSDSCCKPSFRISSASGTE